jgi:hypothetical protein
MAAQADPAIQAAARTAQARLRRARETVLMNPTAWHLISTLGLIVWSVFVYSSCINSVLRDLKPNVDRRILINLRAESKPFALPAVIAMYVAVVAVGKGGWSNNLTLIIEAACWLYWRKDPDDDDRWKKRRKKVAEQVSVVGGRLQVVPVRSS